MTTSVSLAAAKTQLSDLVRRVGREHERVTVTVHGSPSAVLIAPADMEAMEETIEILTDIEAVQRLVQADADLAPGLGETREQLDAVMRRRLTREA